MADNGGSQANPRAGGANVKIEIYDQAYNVNADGQNEEQLKELAAYVDGRMREVAQATRMVDSVKVAVLAALNIADELFAVRGRQQEIDGPLRKRVEKCVALVEKALEHSNGSKGAGSA
jgi:cell division protein ZapA